MSAVIWACDPGADGAFVRMQDLANWRVFLTRNGYRKAYDCMLVDQCESQRLDIYAVFEDLNMRFGDLKKSKSISEMLKNAGRGLCCFELATIAVETVPPTTWQYPFGLVGYEYKERKKLAVKLARYYFGDATLADADAKLIALWKYWQINGIEPPRQPKDVITKLTITKEVNRYGNGQCIKPDS